MLRKVCSMLRKVEMKCEEGFESKTERMEGGRMKRVK